MSGENQVRAAIYSAIEELNQMSPREHRIPLREDAVLAGGQLDSLGLINLIVLVEQKIEEQVGVSISLIDGDMAEGDGSPFGSVQSLAAYVAGVLGQKADV